MARVITPQDAEGLAECIERACIEFAHPSTQARAAHVVLYCFGRLEDRPEFEVPTFTVTIPELAAATGWNSSSCWKTLHVLEDTGLVKRLIRFPYGYPAKGHCPRSFAYLTREV